MASFRDRISMVSPWVDPGNFYKFIDRFPEADRMDLCIQVANGLAYLHENNVIFGDMKAQHVLVGFDGIAMLTDFGLSILDRSKVLFSTTQNPGGGSTRWMAPELIDGTAGRSREADVYALGMTWIEFLTDELPFSQLEDFQVIYAVMIQEKTPERPRRLEGPSERSNQWWSLLTQCFSRQPSMRPTANSLAQLDSKRTQHLESCLAHVLRYGHLIQEGMNTELSVPGGFVELWLESRPSSPPSSRFGTDSALQSNERLMFFVPDFTGDTGTQDTDSAEELLNFLVWFCSHTIGAKQHGAEEQYPKNLQDQIYHELEERIELAHHWITTDLARYQCDDGDALFLIDRLKNLAPGMRAAVRLCLEDDCTKCQRPCLRSHGHSDHNHDCLTDHFCASDCAIDAEHLGSKHCGLPAGHADAHLCCETPHLCGNICDFGVMGSCKGSCIKLPPFHKGHHLCSTHFQLFGKLCDHLKADIRDYNFWFKSSLDKYSDSCKRLWKCYHAHYLYMCAQCGEDELRSPNNILLDNLRLVGRSDFLLQPFAYPSGLSGEQKFRIDFIDISISALRRVWTDQVIGDFIVSRLEWFREQTGTAYEFLVFEINRQGTTADMVADPVWIRLDGQNAISRCWAKLSFRKKLVPLRLNPQASLIFLERISLGYLLGVSERIYCEPNRFTVHAAHSWRCASALVKLLSSEGQAIWEPEDPDCRYYWDSESRHYDPDSRG